MIGIKHPSNNVVLAAPADHDQSKLEVTSLSVTRSYENHIPHTLSYWMPNEDEIASILAGQPVVVGVLGPNWPPMWVGVAT